MDEILNQFITYRVYFSIPNRISIISKHFFFLIQTVLLINIEIPSLKFPQHKFSFY